MVPTKKNINIKIINKYASFDGIFILYKFSDDKNNINVHRAKNTVLGFIDFVFFITMLITKKINDNVVATIPIFLLF